jgi:hypothetical protein
MVIGGIVLIVLAALWLLRGIAVMFSTVGAEQAGSVVGLLLGLLVLVAGVVVLRRGLARRRLS